MRKPTKRTADPAKASQTPPHSDTKDNREIDLDDLFIPAYMRGYEPFQVTFSGRYPEKPDDSGRVFVMPYTTFKTAISAHTSHLLDTLLEAMPKKLSLDDLDPKEKINRVEYAKFVQAYNQPIETITTIIKEMRNK